MNIDVVIGWLTAKQRVVRFGYFGKEKLKEIKLLVSSIGCLTNGYIYISEDQKDITYSDVKDATYVNFIKE